MFETDESKLPRPARVALDALRRCSLTELGAIELYHFRRVKQEVGKRTVAECAAKAAADLAPPFVVDGALAPGEVDEDGDSVTEATPLETFPPDAGPAQV